jgi:pimeloyl-ACP methyl ester carboxylesterase
MFGFKIRVAKAFGWLLALSLLPTSTTAWSQTNHAVPATPDRIDIALEKVACPFDATKALLPVECGRLKVPENYNNPGRMIELAFMTVHPERNTDPANPVIYLSGGPGQPILVYAEMLVANTHIRDLVVDRDWVFYDQRGEGRSIPSLRCPREQDYLKRVAICRDGLIGEGVDLSQYNSMRSARDIEELRKALGVQQWNLWGISYGSRLAFAIARDFPESVRSIIHDGPSYPEGLEIVDDFRGTDIAINRLFSKCAADPACSSKYPGLGVGSSPRCRVRQRPLTVGDETVDDTTLVHFVRGRLFTGDLANALLERRVQTLLAYMDAATRGDGRAMFQVKQKVPEETGDYSAVPVEGWYAMGQNLSVECNEERPFESLEAYRQAASESDIVRALYGEDEGLGNFQDCALWPAGRADPSRKTRISYDGPQLAFSGELDASLSGLSGYKIAMLYPNARNVVFDNAVHGQVELADLPPTRIDPYRACALHLARQFFADPKSSLDTSCAATRKLRLVP